MNLFSLSGISKTLGNEPLFQDITLGIDEGDKIGLLGRNGSGKSTFLRLLNGELEPDGGTLSVNGKITVGTLEQRPVYSAEMTLKEFFFSGDNRTLRLMKEYEDCLKNLQSGREHDRKLAELTRRMEEEKGFVLEATFQSLCRELGLEDMQAFMGTFSGGMVRKAALARCLAPGADFLTLDEPTNHLDIDTIEWLEQFLKEAPFSFVLVTHDRYFLDSVCTSIIEIDSRNMYSYPGNYSTFLQRKTEREEANRRSEQRRVSILRGELEWLKRGPKARAGKDKKRKERIQNLMDSGVREEMSMRELSSGSRRLGKKILELKGISKSFEGREIIRPFSYTFRKGERIGIIGPNASGKTTFLDLVAGRLLPDTGTVSPGVNTEFAYFDQTGRNINKSITVLDYIKEHAQRIEMGQGDTVSAEQFLERFLFPRPMFSLTLDRLSGGELRRLYLVRLLAGTPNFLLLDEPTNDLDLDTLRLLENYVHEFVGCVLLVSHDRAMLDRLTDYLFIFEGDGTIRGFSGNYGEYREITAERKALEKTRPRAAVRKKPVNKSCKPGLSFKEKLEHERLLEEIGDLEEEQKTLEASFLGEMSPGELERNSRRYREVSALIEEKLTRWEELATLLSS